MRTIYQHFEDDDHVYSVPYDFMHIDGLKTDDEVFFKNKLYTIQDIKVGNDGIHFYLNRKIKGGENEN